MLNSRRETDNLSSEEIAAALQSKKLESSRRRVDFVLKDFTEFTAWYQSRAAWEKQKDRNGKTRLIHVAGFCDNGQPLENGNMTPQQNCISVVLSERFPASKSITEDEESTDEFELAIKTAIKAKNIYFFMLLSIRQLIPRERIWDECLNALSENSRHHNGNIEKIEYLFQVIKQLQLPCIKDYRARINAAITGLKDEHQSLISKKFLDACPIQQKNFSLQPVKLQEVTDEKADKKLDSPTTLITKIKSTATVMRAMSLISLGKEAVPSSQQDEAKITENTLQSRTSSVSDEFSQPSDARHGSVDVINLSTSDFDSELSRERGQVVFSAPIGGLRCKKRT